MSWLVDELGMDSAINYKKVDDLGAELGKHCPDKIDIFFDNVGGNHLEAALYHMNRFGRIIGCDMISELNSTTPLPGPPIWFTSIPNESNSKASSAVIILISCRSSTRTWADGSRKDD